MTGAMAMMGGVKEKVRFGSRFVEHQAFHVRVVGAKQTAVVGLGRATLEGKSHCKHCLG